MDINELTRRATSGDAESQLQLGLAYLNGQGAPENPEVGFQWINNAANQKYPRALYEVGKCFMSGKGVAKSSEKAYQYYVSAAELDCSDAFLPAAIYYETQGNMNLYCYWLNKAAGVDNGHTILARYKVARIFEDGLEELGIAADPEKSMKIDLLNAESGDKQSFWRVGHNFEVGYGVGVDLYKAFYWYKKAADSGIEYACDNVSISYTFGFGTPIDYAAAIPYYMRAIEYFKNDLRKASAERSATTANLVKWLSNSEYYLGICYAKLPCLENSNVLAFQQWLSSAERGNAAAAYNVYLCYQEGNGTEEDLEKAWLWLNKAVELGDPKAIKIMNDIHNG